MSDSTAQPRSPATPARATITRLRGEALIEVSGRDAVTFLHNQASCELRQLAIGQASHGTFCNPQGRVLADFLALPLAPDRVLLRLGRDIREATLAALGRFALFSKVSLQAAGDEWLLLGCRGAGCTAALRDVFGELPAQDLAWTGGDSAFLLQLDGASACFEVWINTSARPALPEQLQALVPAAASEEEWRAATLRRGIARITAATAGALLPQQLNYDLTGHINFRKGCYPGQEVIARMHYKGRAKRRLLLMQLPTGSQAAAGAALFLAGREQAAGQVVNAATADNGTVLALVTTTGSAAGEGLRLAPDDTVTLQVLELPYAVPFD